MKKLSIWLVAFSLALAVNTANAQTDKQEQKKIEKLNRKEAREQQYEKNKEHFLSLVNDKTFVIEANTLHGKYMNRYEVTPSTNFVKIEGKSVTVQTAGGFNPGYNGLGGVTIDGTITSYEVREREKDQSINLFIHFSSTAIGHASLSIDIAPDGNASARISDNWGRRVLFRGDFVGLDRSRVFEGMSYM